MASTMDIRNLETASDYINNLLLSRGLLRNGEPISFAHPSQDEGGKQATITKVINLVHDLILQRDRETETTNKLSQDVVKLRNTSAEQVQAIQKLELRNSELERQLTLKSVSEKSATTSLKTTEVKLKGLKDDMARLKGTVAQIRAQCANDVRKKETELRRLQKYLEPKKGREGSVQVGVTVVNPGTVSRSSSSQAQGQQAQKSLFQESIDHLTSLSRQLSVENEALRALTRSTNSTLRDLQGIPDTSASSDDGIVSQSSTIPYQTLESETTEILAQLQSLLTNPSFVSLEEVQIREEEILRLREGWEKMETRWREALSLMHSWRKRMMETGDAINLDDLRKGLVLGSTPITIPPTSVRKGRISVGQLPSPDDSTIEGQEGIISTDLEISLQEATDNVSATIRQDNNMQQEVDNDAIPILEDSSKKLGIGLFPVPNILRPTSGNAQHDSNHSTSRNYVTKSPLKRRRSSIQHEQKPEIDISLAASQDSECGNEEAPLTIEEKLQLARREADDAKTALRNAMATAPQVQTTKHDTSNTRTKPVKRIKAPLRIGAGGDKGIVGGKRSKRRSTLLPEELGVLLGA